MPSLSMSNPVTVWQGEHDTWVPMSHAHRLVAALPRGDLRVVPSTGHVLPTVIADTILHDLMPESS
jgi:pimeloyl-ACP methyl ester carboxylesterase